MSPQTTPTNLRRCPACRNMVARERECPICGWGYGAAVARRVIVWTVLVAVLALLAWRLLRRAPAEPSGSATPTTFASPAA